MTRKVIEEGLTNALWETSDGTVVKYIADSSWTVVVINILQILFLNFEFLTKRKRLENELRAKDVLTGLGVRVPEIVRHDENFIEMEKIDGMPLLRYLMDADPGECYERGLEKGRELERLHDHGSAYVDCRCGNTMVVEEGLVSVDHELFREEDSGFLKELDLITLTATAKVLPQRQYACFIRGLEDGYSDLFRIDKGFRTLFTAVGMMGQALIVKRSPRLALRCWKNWRMDFDEHLRRLPVLS